MEPVFAFREATQYPIVMELQYTTREGTRRVGMGLTKQISSRDVVFTADQAVQQGTKLEISISWPVLLNGRIPLKVVVEGEVTACQETLVTARIVKYQFRTRRAATAPSETVKALIAGHHAAAAVHQGQEALCAR